MLYCECDYCLDKKPGGHCNVHRNSLGCHFNCTKPTKATTITSDRRRKKSWRSRHFACRLL